MDPEKAYLEAKQRFIQTAAWVTFLSLLLMAASRIPALEVTSPVAWLSGGFNIVMISLLGPILILAGFCWVCLSAADLIDLRMALLASRSTLDPAVRDVLMRLPVIDSTPYPGRTARLSLRLMDGFVFGLPLLCYLVLFFGYLELVRPVKPDSTLPMFETRPLQVADLFSGLGGAQGFEPFHPSVAAALRKRAQGTAQNSPSAWDHAADPNKAIPSTSGDMPWIYPPWQTWAYVGGFAVLCVVAFRTWRNGHQSVGVVQQKHFAIESLPPGTAPQGEVIKPLSSSKEAK